MDEIAIYDFLHPSWINKLEPEIRYAIFGSYSKDLLPMRRERAFQYQFNKVLVDPIIATSYAREEVIDAHVPILMAEISERMKEIPVFKNMGLTALVPFNRMKKQQVSRTSNEFDKFVIVSYSIELPTLHEKNAPINGMSLDLTFRSNLELIEWRTSVPLGITAKRAPLLQKEDQEDFSFTYILHEKRNQFVPVYKIKDVVFNLGNIYNLPAVPHAGRLPYFMRSSNEAKAERTQENKQGHINRNLNLPTSLYAYQKMNREELEQFASNVNEHNQEMYVSLRENGFQIEFLTDVHLVKRKEQLSKELQIISKNVSAVPGVANLLNHESILPLNQMELVSSYSKFDQTDKFFYHFYGRNLELYDTKDNPESIFPTNSYGLEMNYLVELNDEFILKRIIFSHPPIIGVKKIKTEDLYKTTKNLV